MLDPRSFADVDPDALAAYARAHASPEDPLLRELAEETRRRTQSPQMMTGHAEGLFLRALVRMLDARRILEVGTFTGYSALAMAAGLPDDGEIVTCDVDPEATAIARAYWARSPHGGKIRLVLAPALETIASLAGPLDLVFIDADKQSYVAYWEACVPKVRPGGALVVDNALWSGRVLDPQDDDSRAIAAFNAHVTGDERVEHQLLGIRDGLMLAVVRRAA
jgi:caffeoyl-CoA O-methyltransferase